MSREFELLDRLRPLLAGDGPGIPLGFGDDAAVVEIGGARVALATDALVDAIHFDRAISSTEDVGWKALAVNVSDLAAVAARPVAALVALHLPRTTTDEAIDGLYRGLRTAADRWGAALVGGDVVSSPVLALTVSIIGEVTPDGPLRRDGCRPGDHLVLVGRLGLAAAGLALHRAGETDELERHPELLAAHRRPEALVDAGLVLAAAGATGCIDVSDGLGRDAGHLARRSAVRITIREDALPSEPAVEAAAARLGRDDLALAGGDDHALLATVGSDRLDAVRQRLHEAGHRAHVIGEVTEGDGVLVRRRDGTTEAADDHGWEHPGSRPSEGAET